jgi:hypothetical protein
MSIASYPNSLDGFFTFAQAAIRQYKAVGAGKLVVDCEKRLHDGGEPRFKLIAYGALQSPFCLTPAHLDNYRLRRQLQLAPHELNKPFYHLEESLLEILGKTGHGKVALEFEKDRRGNIVVLCFATFSYRCVVLPEAQVG